MTDKILVTGSSGYIGSNLMERLKYYGIEGVPYDLKTGEDINDASPLLRKSKDCTAIIHLAAIASVEKCELNPKEAQIVNLNGTASVALVAHKRKIPLVFASSSAAANPVSIYGKTKLDAETWVAQIGGVSLRLGNVYGGINFREKDTVITRFMTRRLRGKKAIIYGNGLQTRDFVHVLDVCEALLYAIAAEPGVYEVSTGRTTSINRLAELFGLDVEYQQSRKGDVYQVRPNAINWLPLWTPKMGLEEWVKTICE